MLPKLRRGSGCKCLSPFLFLLFPLPPYLSLSLSLSLWGTPKHRGEIDSYFRIISYHIIHLLYNLLITSPPPIIIINHQSSRRTVRAQRQSRSSTSRGPINRSRNRTRDRVQLSRCRAIDQGGSTDLPAPRLPPGAVSARRESREHAPFQGR